MTSPDFSSFKLLVAEDNLPNYEFIKAVARLTTINIIHANDGQQAVALCDEHDFDLIIMDAMMPGMSGFEATRQIKAKYPDIPVIMLTAYATQTSIREAVEAGCNDYLAKPIDKDSLLAALTKWLIGSQTSEVRYF